MIKKKYTHNNFIFESGQYVEHLDLVYHISSDYDTNKKVVWICHALTANSNPLEWWRELVGEGRLFDPRKYNIICVNSLGSPYGSSRPSSIDPKTGKPYYFSFPQITVKDIVNSFILVREHLGIKEIDFLVGCSVGGFHAMEWCVKEPDIINKAAFIACGYRVSPWLSAFNESMKMALEADKTFLEAKNLDGGKEGLKCARSIALISYRSYDGYNLTQCENDKDCIFAKKAGSYQRYQGEKLADRFDAYSYYYLVNACNSGNIGRNRGGCIEGLSQIKAQITVIGTDSDNLFPTREQKFIAEHIQNARYDEISSKFGHDGFLIEYNQLEDILKKSLT